jgi:hypothetical protein
MGSHAIAHSPIIGGPAYLRVPPLARLLLVKNGGEVNARGTLSKNMVWVSGCLPLQHWEKNLLLGPNRVLPGRVNACACASAATQFSYRFLGTSVALAVAAFVGAEESIARQ